MHAACLCNAAEVLAEPDKGDHQSIEAYRQCSRRMQCARARYFDARASAAPPNAVPKNRCLVRLAGVNA